MLRAFFLYHVTYETNHSNDICRIRSPAICLRAPQSTCKHGTRRCRRIQLRKCVCISKRSLTTRCSGGLRRVRASKRPRVISIRFSHEWESRDFSEARQSYAYRADDNLRTAALLEAVRIIKLRGGLPYTVGSAGCWQLDRKLPST